MCNLKNVSICNPKRVWKNGLVNYTTIPVELLRVHTNEIPHLRVVVVDSRSDGLVTETRETIKFLFLNLVFVSLAKKSKFSC